MQYANISIRLTHIVTNNSVFEGITSTKCKLCLNIQNIKLIIGGNAYENTIYPPQHPKTKVPITILNLRIQIILRTSLSAIFLTSKSENHTLSITTVTLNTKTNSANTI